ncbi:MAG TPA: prevent-host-death family protein [Nitrospinae bacterium]|nr:MAG: prevent-host-death family protein [Deltaproteobacteria bacterium GWD2_42_10]OGQ66248.1 MAG: prevent-host-death family protein [Deltaproteobacteria bacterium RIFCSPLOWO2_12_FULL_42_16]HAP66257.1 prevent-host-death family protein [Nitrospinota bacterium]HLG29011.1 type II toxin-antitoxin system Phd/YefM family antitoxin [Candidatus Brocadiales bacterium]
MITLHPEFLTKDGKKEFVVLTYEEFVAIQELIEDAEDVLDLRAAKQEEKSKPSVPLEDVKKDLGIS